MNKCVYLHKDAEGVVRYVGSGTIRRANTTCAKSDRGARYNDFVITNGKLSVEIVAQHLTKAEAEDIERLLYDEYRETILNHRRPNSPIYLSKEMFDSYLQYDETSSTFLRWKVDSIKNVKAGDEAGSKNSQDYLIVSLKGKTYQSHRIIAILHGLDVNGKLIDHIDRDRSNNKISNLRSVTPLQNSRNIGNNSKNVSGIPGVRFNESKNSWIVYWQYCGKQKFKDFSISRYLSSEAAFEAACNYRKQMVDLYYN